MERKEEKQIVRNGFFDNDLPNLEKAQAAALELTGEYWTPQQENECRRAFFNELRMETAIDEKSGQDVELLTAYFVWVVDGTKKVFKNASKRLVGVIENYNIAKGTPLEITYLGKQKNKNNSYFCDTWSIKPLIIE